MINQVPASLVPYKKLIQFLLRKYASSLCAEDYEEMENDCIYTAMLALSNYSTIKGSLSGQIGSCVRFFIQSHLYTKKLKSDRRKEADFSISTFTDMSPNEREDGPFESFIPDNYYSIDSENKDAAIVFSDLEKKGVFKNIKKDTVELLFERAKGFTCQQLADKRHISRQRVDQLCKAAIAKAQKNLKSLGRR